MSQRTRVVARMEGSPDSVGCASCPADGQGAPLLMPPSSRQQQISPVPPGGGGGGPWMGRAQERDGDSTTGVAAADPATSRGVARATRCKRQRRRPTLHQLPRHFNTRRIVTPQTDG
ncbi:unnamed protein product [Lampetra fluviatilis]